MKRIQILGTGCPKCTKLAENADAAVKELGEDYEIEKVTDISEIMKFGVMMTPVLAVDGNAKTIVFIMLVVVMSTIVRMLFGAIWG
ncbi:MAG: thioredoxin family protein [Phycisphaerales bacterium]|nr:MAG: thioredoxin family protein [Phycisphaerales bacterium]